MPTKTSSPAKTSSPTKTNSTTGVRNTSDAAVKAATGKDWKQWFATLDRDGAAELDHKGIVALASKHGAGPWWQQMVTVEYEQARGLRKKHEKPEGYQISRSKTLGVPMARLYGACADAKLSAQWLPKAKLEVTKATANRSLRMRWLEDDTRVEFMFYATPSGKAQVAVQHSKLANEKLAVRMKSYWGDALERLEQLLAD